MDKKTLIGIAALFAFILIWSSVILPSLPKEWIYKELPPVPAESRPLNLQGEISTPAVQAQEAGSVKLESPATVAVPESSVVLENLPEQKFILENDVLKATFSSKGGVLSQLEAKDYHPTIRDSSALILLQHPSMVINQSRADMQGEIVETSEGKTLTFWNAQRKIIYRLPQKDHFFQLEIQQAQVLPLVISLPEIENDPSVMKGGLNHGIMGGIVNLKSRSYADNSAAIADQELKTAPRHFAAPTGDLTWTGFRNKYFTVFLEPEKNNLSAHSIVFESFNGRGQLNLKTEPAQNLSYKIFAGPLDKGHLYALDAEKYGSLFNYTGINVIIHFLLWILNAYNAIPGINMGVAILMLTITVKCCLFPLNLKAQSSMFMMSKIGPEIKAMQEKFKNDRQQQGLEQMKLFKKHGVNPMAGCLPMLLQMPVMISLFSTVGEGFSLRHAPFVGWIKDLSAPDACFSIPYEIPYLGAGDGTTYINLLVIFYVVTMLLQQSMMPKSTDPQQMQMQKMMKFMMIGFAFLLYNYSSGLMLYFVASNLLGMLESWYIRNRVIPTFEKKLNLK